MNNLMDFFQKHDDKVTDRWSSYINQYQRLFHAFRDQPIRLLEIGIQNGGSLDIWGQYFPKATHLVGCDVNPLCHNLKYDDPRIQVIVGDASQNETVMKINALSQVWDIVIDDGSHHSRHIVDSFAQFFPKISDGGMYIAEDLHCSYWKEYEGGLFNPFSSMTFFKKLADIINFEHWGTSLSLKNFLADFENYYDCKIDVNSLKQIHSIEFTNSQCIIHKRPEEQNILGHRIIVGVHEEAHKGGLQYHETLMTAPNQSNNPHSIPEINNELEKYKKINDLTNLIEYRDHQIAHYQKQLAQRDAQVALFMAANHSTSARIARILLKIAEKYLPTGSLRRRTAQKALNLFKKIRVHGFIGTLGIIKNRLLRLDLSFFSNKNLAEPREYASWIAANEPSQELLNHQRDSSLPYQPDSPLFSIILPVYKISPEVLTETIKSVQQQTWKNWELCIAYADLENEGNWLLLEKFANLESRIKIRKLSTNGGISINSNAALEFANGAFIALLDHDDLLTPWALYDMASAIEKQPNVDFLYSDRDCINTNGNLRLNPLFKPQWSPELMYSANYLTHFNVMRRSIVKEIGGWNPLTDGAQDWDIFLRVIERSREVKHIPAIHYHWRIIAGSTASEGFAAKPYAALGQLRTLEMRVQRLGLNATVMPHPESNFHILWKQDNNPCVDLILYGNIDDAPMNLINEAIVQLGVQLASVTILTDPNNKKLLPSSLPGKIPLHVITTQSHDTLAIYEAIKNGHASSVLLINSGVSKILPDTLKELTGWTLNHPEISFTAPLLLNKENKIVEAGLTVGDNYHSRALFQNMPLNGNGPFGAPLWYRNISAASPYTIAFKRDQFNLESHLSLPLDKAIIACCAEAESRGFRGMISPHARVQIDKKFKKDFQWDNSFKKDPYFHPAIRSLLPFNHDN